MNEADRRVEHIKSLAAYGDRLARVSTLEDVITSALAGLDELFGWSHCLLLVHQPELGRLATVGSHGYEVGGAGSEVALGEGVIGMAGARCRTMRIGNLQRMLQYARSLRHDDDDSQRMVAEIRLPGLVDARSQLAAPMLSRGALLGVLAAESSGSLVFDELDEHVLAVAAHLVAGAFEREQLATTDFELDDQPDEQPTEATPVHHAPRNPSTSQAGDGAGAGTLVLRHYAADGSTFLDDDYIIKGVAGRLLWKVVSDHVATGRTAFTNREAKLDPVLELPEYRDNFESRLILLKKRLEERGAPVRIYSGGRGRFELEVTVPLHLDHVTN